MMLLLIGILLLNILYLIIYQIFYLKISSFFIILIKFNFRIFGAISFSCYWHGVHFGYFASFYSAILIAISQKYFKTCFISILPTYNGTYKSQQLFQNAIQQKSIIKLSFTLFLILHSTRLIEYAIIPFFFLNSYSDWLLLWKQLFYYGHLYALLLFIAGFTKTFLKQKNL